MEEDLGRMATELTRQANQLHETQLELQRLATTTIKLKNKHQWLRRKPALGQGPRAEEGGEKFWPETYTADGGQEELRGVLGRGPAVPECAGTWRDFCWSVLLLSATSQLCRDVEVHEAVHGNLFDWNLAVLKIDGFNAWEGVGILVPGQIHE